MKTYDFISSDLKIWSGWNSHFKIMNRNKKLKIFPLSRVDYVVNIL